MRLLCWEGYDRPEILGEFARSHSIQATAQTLLSDAHTAQELLASDSHSWDVLNINNAWVQDYLCDRGKIMALSENRFAPAFDKLLPEFDRLGQWARDRQGNIIGICQRFGAFNLVVNSDRIDSVAAEDQGFNLAHDPKQRFGILSYDDFTIFHICLGANLNPFIELDDQSLQAFSAVATDWFDRAELITDDHKQLNRALLAGDIDFYISGGVYTVSEARLNGHTQLLAITPRSGSIEGLGGIVFTEITSVLQATHSPALGTAFLEFILQPEIAHRVATCPDTLNPVAQMADAAVFDRFSKQQLDAIQWDTLSADIDRCAMYQIPPNQPELLRRLQQARHAAGKN